MRARFAILFLTLIAPGVAHAQGWQDEWKALTAKVKGQTLSAIVATEQSYSIAVAEFGKRFGVQVELTPMRPSSALARVQTEQKNDRFVWDIWVGGTSNMVNTASPGGLLAQIDPFFLLPEVKDPENWLHADFLFGDSARRVFTFSNREEFYVLRNKAIVPELKVTKWTDLLDPRLKGKVSMRDSSVPNGGSFVLATLHAQAGGDVLRKLLKDQDVKIFENPQQLEAAIMRGGQAISIGLETYLWDKCRADGGCKEIDQVRELGSTITTGFSVPKNPPHPDVVKAFINWFLSKEGQDFWVTTWAAENTNGGVSMRKDVKPAPGHEIYLPDFSNPENYVMVASERGSKEIDAAIKIFKETTGR